jgi:hypothetical protein
LQYWQYGKLGARRLIKQTCYPCTLFTPSQSWIKIKIIKIRNGLSRNQKLQQRV